MLWKTRFSKTKQHKKKTCILSRGLGIWSKGSGLYELSSGSPRWATPLRAPQSLGEPGLRGRPTRFLFLFPRDDAVIFGGVHNGVPSLSVCSFSDFFFLPRRSWGFHLETRPLHQTPRTWLGVLKPGCLKAPIESLLRKSCSPFWGSFGVDVGPRELHQS